MKPDSRGRYVNPWPTRAPVGHQNVLRWALAHSITRPRDPARPVVSVMTPSFEQREPSDALAITWIGHSSVLVQIGGLNVITDPVWASRASPFSFVGPRRRLPPAVPVEALPPIDVVVISHNHYDHLDLATVRLLTRRSSATVWLVPIGVGHLVESMGASSVIERSWWEAYDVGGLLLTCVPAQHASGRGLWDRNRSLWCGWTMQTRVERRRSVYFAGDSAYCPAFVEIGARLGPFDACLMPIGAYHPRWYMQFVHMTPEEAVRAFDELTGGETVASAFVPIHWGTFRIADDPLEEPPRRLESAWAAMKLPPKSLAILGHGETRRWCRVTPNADSTV